MVDKSVGFVYDISAFSMKQDRATLRSDPSGSWVL